MRQDEGQDEGQDEWVRMGIELEEGLVAGLLP